MQRLRILFSGALFLISVIAAEAQQAGSIRGTVTDNESETPLAAAQVLIAETGAKATASDEGSFVFDQVPPGKYTLVFSKDGYTRQVDADVTVSEGQMTDANASLAGEYTDMDEFVVQKVAADGGTEEGLLNLRMESSTLMDSVGAEAMSRAGASDAAGALRLVAGASVQDGKYAVVRGLPDRYVSSQMNGVRLPTADANKRAVQLDQFPSEMIENIQVSKTFTPDQQGDASGGAVNVVLKGIPDKTVLKFSMGTEFNTQATGNDDFLTYQGGGVNFWGLDKGSRDKQPVGTNWTGAVGVSRSEPPPAYNWSLLAGGKKEVADGLKVGGLGNFYYKQKSSYRTGVDDKYVVSQAGAPLAPWYKASGGQDTTSPSADFKTALFDKSQGTEEVQWGGLGAVGLETENNALTLLYMRTQATEDKATLTEDTRGKDYFVTSQHPGYDPQAPATNNDYRFAAPYLRNQTLSYTERKTDTLQLHGKHTLPFQETGFPGWFVLLPPEVDWTVAQSLSGLNSPDKRQFGSLWRPANYNTYKGKIISTNEAGYYQNQTEGNFDAGNLERIWQEISEESQQCFVNGKLPFEQWSGDKGYLKVGTFNDKVERTYTQDSYANPQLFTTTPLPWNHDWSDVFPYQNQPMNPTDFTDVNYKGKQNISAWYYMADVPLCSFFKVTGGTRYEQTELSTVLDPDPNVYAADGHGGSATLSSLPDHGNANFQHQDVLPAIGCEFTPVAPVKLRASYSETVARQTFKELTPVQQSEYLGGNIFVGNENLGMSSLKNYDLRADYTPVEGSLVSVSWFRKDITDPIEYIQDYIYNIGPCTRPVNYPEGTLSGYEFEVRQQLGRFWNPLEGLAVGANATFISSEVTLPNDALTKDLESYGASPTRDMINAPEYLYNLNLTYDIQKTGTQFGFFYTVQGDALVAGSGKIAEGYAPDVYSTQYGTLNFSVSQKISERWKVNFKAKNLLDPDIQEVYRYNGEDTVKTSYKKGMDFSISASCEF